MAHERGEHRHRSLIPGSHELRVDDQFCAGVVLGQRQLDRQAQLALAELAGADVEMRPVVLADFVASELKAFPESLTSKP